MTRPYLVKNSVPSPVTPLAGCSDAGPAEIGPIGPTVRPSADNESARCQPQLNPLCRRGLPVAPDPLVAMQPSSSGAVRHGVVGIAGLPAGEANIQLGPTYHSSYHSGAKGMASARRTSSGLLRVNIPPFPVIPKSVPFRMDDFSRLETVQLIVAGSSMCKTTRTVSHRTLSKSTEALEKRCSHRRRSGHI